jgi:sialate O-acetylesterase
MVFIMNDTPWPGQRCAAISLTFDDPKASHTERVAPMLADHGLRGTFYTPINSGLLRTAETWRGVAEAGHELGNHSIFHPCRRRPGRNWPDASYDLNTYSWKRFSDEIRVANEVLSLIDGRDPDGRQHRTYGNTCHCTTIGSGDELIAIDEHLDGLVLAARGPVCAEPIVFDQAKPMNLGTIGIDRRSAEEIIALIDQARAQGGWFIFTAHDLADGEGLALAPQVLEEVCQHLKAHADEVQTGTVREIVGVLPSPAG